MLILCRGPLATSIEKCQGASVPQHLDPGIPNHHMVTIAAQFLKPDMPPARTILYRRRERAVVPLYFLVLFVQIQILNQRVVQDHLDMGTFEGNLVPVPFRWFIDLFGGRNGTVNSAREF